MLSARLEIRQAARSLRRSPLVSSSIVATLAICLAAVTAVYAVVDVVLVRGLPFKRPEQLIWVSSVSRDRPDRPFSLPELMDYRAQARSVRVGAYTSLNAIIETPSGAVRLQGLRMTGDALSILGATPAIGRGLTVDDDAAGAPRVLVLGYGYWRRAFAGDPTIVGRHLTLNGERFTVVGVLPEFFPIPVRDVEAVVPLDPESDPRRHARGSVNFLRMFGRIAPGATAAGAERELGAIASRLREQFPTEYGAKLGVRVTPLQQYLAATQRPTLMILVACVTLMIAIALANVLNLLLARAVSRQGETAVRLALGASTPRIAIQLLIEGSLLVAAAGAVGVGLAQLAISYATSRLALLTPRIEEARLSFSVLGLVFGICAITVLLLSLVPMLVARSVSPQTALRGAGRLGSGSPAQARMRSSFVAAEVALAVVITSATAALVQSLMGLQRVELGFRPDSVFVARVSLPPKAYRTPADVARFITAMGSGLSSAPGVVAAGGSSVAPLSGVVSAIPFAPAQTAPALRRDWGAANFRAVSSGYFAAIGARQIAGRLIVDDDDGAAPAVAVVNRTLADRYFKANGAVGRELLIDDTNSGPRSLTIVGVVDDLRETDLDAPVSPEVFISLEQVHADGVSLVTATQFWAVRVRTDAAAFGPAFARVLHDVDPAVAMAGSIGLRGYVDAAIAPRRFSVSVLVAFTLIALLLTTLGVYGITAYVVEQRRREVGVRMALGATPASIVALMIGRTLRVAGIGVGVGVVGAYLAGGVMSRMMFGVSARNPVMLAVVSVFLLSTAILASWLPGRRAARVDALRALSSE